MGVLLVFRLRVVRPPPLAVKTPHSISTHNPPPPPASVSNPTPHVPRAFEPPFGIFFGVAASGVGLSRACAPLPPPGDATDPAAGIGGGAIWFYTPAARSEPYSHPPPLTQRVSDTHHPSRNTSRLRRQILPYHQLGVGQTRVGQLLVRERERQRGRGRGRSRTPVGRWSRDLRVGHLRTSQYWGQRGRGSDVQLGTAAGEDSAAERGEREREGEGERESCRWNPRTADRGQHSGGSGGPGRVIPTLTLTLTLIAVSRYRDSDQRTPTIVEMPRRRVERASVCSRATGLASPAVVFARCCRAGCAIPNAIYIPHLRGRSQTPSEHP